MGEEEGEGVPHQHINFWAEEEAKAVHPDKEVSLAWWGEGWNMQKRDPPQQQQQQPAAC
jgi:hypothetical protein